MTANIVGATGATGRELLRVLLGDPEFESVSVFVRKDPGLQHSKLSAFVINFDRPEEWQHLVKGDVLFSCLGTTLKAAGSKEAQRKVDFDYQLLFATIAKQNGIKKYILVSADHADERSRLFYPRMKGELEVAIRVLKFPALVIFNPPILVRNNSDRLLERLGVKVIQVLNKFGFLRSQKPMPTSVLANAMAGAALSISTGEHSFKPPQIWSMAHK